MRPFGLPALILAVGLCLGIVPGPIAMAQGAGEDMPKPVVQVAPVYPAEAADKRLEGNVTLEFTVTPDGGVKDAKVIQSSDPVFETPALDAVVQWKYSPAKTGGKPAEYKGMRVVLSFRLAGDGE